MPYSPAWGKWLSIGVLGFSWPTIPQGTDEQMVGVFSVKYAQMTCQVPRESETIDHTGNITFHVLDLQKGPFEGLGKDLPEIKMCPSSKVLLKYVLGFLVTKFSPGVQ